MNELQVFNHKDFGGIRVLQIEGQPWFVGKDVAGILGYDQARKAIIAHVDAEDGMKHTILSNGGAQDTWIINESGFYSLVLSSKLPKAKEFRRWVTSEVIPSIMRTGGYVKGNEMDFIIQSVTKNTIQAVMEQLPAIVAETVKTTLNMVLNHGENALNMPLTKDKPKKRRISYHGKLDKLPIELRNEVVTMIFQKDYTYLQVSEMLKEHGVSVHYSSIGRYARRLADNVDGLPGIEIEN